VVEFGSFLNEAEFNNVTFYPSKWSEKTSDIGTFTKLEKTVALMYSVKIIVLGTAK
jgi:hypothetical protein